MVTHMAVHVGLKEKRSVFSSNYDQQRSLGAVGGPLYAPTTWAFKKEYPHVLVGFRRFLSISDGFFGLGQFKRKLFFV